MEKRLKIITIVNIISLIIALLILRFSEIYRGQNPLYVTLKIIGWSIFCYSILASLINTLYIYFEKTNIWKKKILWIILSLFPVIYIFIIVAFSLINTCFLIMLPNSIARISNP